MSAPSPISESEDPESFFDYGTDFLVTYKTWQYGLLLLAKAVENRDEMASDFIRMASDNLKSVDIPLRGKKGLFECTQSIYLSKEELCQVVSALAKGTETFETLGALATNNNLHATESAEVYVHALRCDCKPRVAQKFMETASARLAAEFNEETKTEKLDPNLCFLEYAESGKLFFKTNQRFKRSGFFSGELSRADTAAAISFTNDSGAAVSPGRNSIILREFDIGPDGRIKEIKSNSVTTNLDTEKFPDGETEAFSHGGGAGGASSSFSMENPLGKAQDAVSKAGAGAGSGSTARVEEAPATTRGRGGLGVSTDPEATTIQHPRVASLLGKKPQSPRRGFGAETGRRFGAGDDEGRGGGTGRFK